MAVPDKVRAVLLGLEGPVGIACSGGGDSLALLLIARETRPDLHVVTVDHGLRPEAAAEAAQVRDRCAAIGVPHQTLTLTLPDGPALMSRARAARYDAMADWGATAGIPTICLGHTADDVAETLVMRLSDGVGVDGLARMDDQFQRGDVTFHRPLLDMRRETLRDIVNAAGWSWVEDPSNTDPRFERSRIRATMASLDLDPAPLARSASALRDARIALDWQMERIAQEIIREDRGDWQIARPDLSALPDDLIRRLILKGLRWIGGSVHPPRHEEQSHLMRVLKGAGKFTLAGTLIEADAQQVRLSREPVAATRSPDRPVGQVWDGRWTVHGPAGTVRALGDAVGNVDWRATGLPRSSLRAGPAVWDGSTLLGVPLVPGGPWSATCRGAFARNDHSR